MVRRIALAALGVSSIVRGASYLGPHSPNSAPPQLAFVDQAIPLSGYAIGWTATGVFALVAVLFRHLQTAVLSFAIFFNLLWALSFALSWVVLGVPRAYISATSYLVIAILALCVGVLYERVTLPDPPEGGACRQPKGS
ncbi:hypothetical protein [Rhodococcus rhodochrous]|uniref:hypothetical protein n=1 Tax=Rhodococcus rhodochrous TaxID=1829 RepID=UPI00178502A3|nr:hypothetical protein [Rhodococcus rhodochrous]QOH55269.1 hypothetical protein C6Y44_04240 [Rhodococcus rhodochrous]